MKSEAPIDVGSAVELIDLLEFESVIFLQLAATRISDTEATSTQDGSVEPELQVMVKNEDDILSVRCVATVSSPDARYVADAVATFRAAHPLNVDPSVHREFVERAGLISLYPFVRQAIFDLSTRLGSGEVLLGLFRPGRIRLDDHVDEPAEGTTSEE